MSVVKLSIEKDYGFVILVVIFSIFINFWAGMKVGKARKLYDVQYPQVSVIADNRRLTNDLTWP
jgi:glutathione S-transferase